MSFPVARFCRFSGFAGDRHYALTKTIGFVNGALAKSAPPNAGSGEYSNILSGVDGLAHILATMRPHECLVAGWTDREEGLISTSSFPKPGTIHRTKDFFTFPAGPGLLLLDHDADPDHAQLTPAALLEVLTAVFPGFADAARVVNYSASSFIYSPDGQLLSPPKPGFHTYILVRDATDIPRAGRVLFKRLWLAGYGWGTLGRSGSFYQRGIIDASVFSPERCAFEASPTLLDGLVQKRPKPAAFHGGYLDTHALPDLTSEEEVQFAALVAAERQRLKPQQEPRFGRRSRQLDHCSRHRPH